MPQSQFENGDFTKEFLKVINSIIDDRLANLDRTEICQVVSMDNSSGLYDVKLVSDTNVVIKNVVNCTDFSFTSGDYVYVIKIHNNLSNAIIIGTNSPKMTQQSTNQ